MIFNWCFPLSVNSCIIIFSTDIWDRIFSTFRNSSLLNPFISFIKYDLSEFSTHLNWWFIQLAMLNLFVLFLEYSAGMHWATLILFELTEWYQMTGTCWVVTRKCQYDGHFRSMWSVRNVSQQTWSNLFASQRSYNRGQHVSFVFEAAVSSRTAIVCSDSVRTDAAITVFVVTPTDSEIVSEAVSLQSHGNGSRLCLICASSKMLCTS